MLVTYLGFCPRDIVNDNLEKSSVLSVLLLIYNKEVELSAFIKSGPANLGDVH